MTATTVTMTGPDGRESPPMTIDDLERVHDAVCAGASRPGKKLKETDADRGVKDRAYGVAADELRAFVERFERLAAEIGDLRDDQKVVMAEAKARGYDTRAIRRIIALRKRDKDEIAEEEAVLDLYKAALGMA